MGGGVPGLTIDGEDLPFVLPPPSPELGAGCAHALCVPGDQLDPSCDPCVAAICERDPYCCEGGYHSYYSTEPTWDAKCIAEVKTYCPSAAANGCTAPLPRATPRDIPTVTRRLVAGVHYTFELYYDNIRYPDVLDSRGRDKTVRLLWETTGMQKQVVPQYALYPG